MVARNAKCVFACGSGVCYYNVLMHEWLCHCSMGKRRKPGHVAETATWLARRAEVVQLVRLGYNYRSIASTKRVSVGFVAAAVKRYKETKSHCDRPRSGGPLKATPAVVKKTLSLLRAPKGGTLRKVQAKLRSQGIDISRGTVLNIAHRVGARSAVRIPKPKLTPEHRAARLAWVEARKDDDEKTIQKLVFADEKKFSVTDATNRVWLLPHEPTPIRETRKHPCMLGCFCFCCVAQPTHCLPPTITLLLQLVAFAACVMLDHRFVRLLRCFFLYCREIRSNGEHLSCDH
jgi:transposase